MSGIYYTNPYSNPWIPPDYFGQYGVDTQNDVVDTAAGVASASGMPLLGAGLSLVGNIAGQYFQNQSQRELFNAYMSPAARMAQMKAAGINPNAAAQGIAGAPAPQMNAAPPTSAFSGVGEQLGQSVNSALTADVLRTEAEKNTAEKNLTDSLNVEKTTTNRYLDAQQRQILMRMVNENRITQSTANMIAVDEQYKPASAAASFGILVNQLEQSALEIDKLVSSIELDYAHVYQAMANAALSEAEIHKVFSDIGLNNAQINKISHEVAEIDARTAATYQGITESEARTELIRTQRNYEQKYLDIFNKSGVDMKSSVNQQFFGLLAQGKYDAAKEFLGGLENYIQAEGDGRAHGKDYKLEQTIDALKVYGMFLGIGSLGKIGTRFSTAEAGSKLVNPYSPEGQTVWRGTSSFIK